MHREVQVPAAFFEACYADSGQDPPPPETAAQDHTTEDIDTSSLTQVDVASVSEPQARVLRVIDRTDPEFYIPTRVADVEIRGLLDSGAMVSLIHTRTYQRLLAMVKEHSPLLLGGPDNIGVILPVPGLFLRMAGGKNTDRIVPQGKVILPVVIGQRLELHEFILLDTLIHDLIAGKDLLVKFGIVVDFKHKKVFVSEGASLMVVASSQVGLMRETREVAAAGKVVLRARTLTPVPAVLRTNTVLFHDQEGQFWPSARLPTVADRPDRRRAPAAPGRGRSRVPAA